jgi:hypothetical protein
VGVRINKWVVVVQFAKIGKTRRKRDLEVTEICMVLKAKIG